MKLAHLSLATLALFMFLMGSPGNKLNAQCEPNARIIMPGYYYFQIPECQESIQVVFSVQIIDHCIAPSLANLSFNLGGAPISPTYTIAARGYFEFARPIDLSNDNDLFVVSYTDTAGNNYIIDALFNVEKEAVEEPRIILPGNYTFKTMPCMDSVEANFSVLFQTDCLPPNVANASFYLGASQLTPSSTDTAGGCFEFVEVLYPADDGEKLIVLYLNNGDTVRSEKTVRVIQIEDPKTPVIIPGNYTYVLPECQDEMTVVISVQILEPCGVPDPGNATFTLGGNPLSLNFFNSSQGYFEFFETISLADNATLMVVSYTDNNGNNHAIDAVVTVLQSPDPPFAPSCFAEVNVALDSFCRAEISYKQLLGGCVGCLGEADIFVNVNDSTPGNDTIDAPGTYTFDVEIPSMDYVCSGIVNARGFGQYALCNDQDGDGVPDDIDICPTVPNGSQTDSNGNGIGDDCEGIAGSDINSIANASGDVVIENSARGIVLKSADGNCYRLNVDGFGQVKSTKIACL